MASAPHSSSILSTHSGHHRIFIGPAVQRKHHHHHTHLHSNSSTSDPNPNGSSNSPGPLKRAFPLHRQNPSTSQAPKPWWDQQHFLRSHISMHGINHHAATFSIPSKKSTSANNNHNNITTTTTTDPDFQQLQQSSIPTLSYVFSDHGSDSDFNLTEDEEAVSHDSYADEMDDDQDDQDISHDEVDDIDVTAHPPFHNHPYRHSSSTTGSSESNSARVGQSPSQQQHQQQRQQLQQQLQNDRWPPSNNDDTKGKKKDKGKKKAVDKDDDKPEKTGISRWESKEKKRTKSMRDEGEHGRLKNFFGRHKKRPIPDDTVFDDPDLGWHSDSASHHKGLARQPTSGTLAVSHHQELVPHHTILVVSPLSSEVDLLSANSHNGGPVFVSSPASSLLNVSIHGDDDKDLERPDPSPLQRPKSDDEGEKEGKGKERASESDRLGPHVWKPSHSGTSSSSPKNSKLQRGTTWMTARESTSTIGSGLLQAQIIQGDEIKEEDEEDEDEEEHYTLAKVISQDSVARGAGVGSGSVTRKQEAATTAAPLASSDNKTSDQGVGVGVGTAAPTSSPDKAVKDLAVLEKKHSSSKDSKDSEESKESLTRTLGKAGTRFGRALLNRAPTILKRRDDIHIEVEERGPANTICSLDKDCQMSLRSGTQNNNNSGNSNKKHVRFLTKVQYQIAASRQSTVVATSPVVKQDRMLIRKEVTERPGPHVFNMDTARKMERQSLGWKEWWCVMKGPPADKMPVTKIKKKSIEEGWKEKGRIELYYNHIYTLLHGTAPIPSFIELGIPDFDVRIRVPIPDDPDSDEDDDDDYTTEEDSDSDGFVAAAATDGNTTPRRRFKTAATNFPQRMASKTFYLNNDDSKPTLVAPDEVTPKLLRSHALSLLKQVPDWTEVVSLWKDPKQHGDVALCWKRYDRIEWIYWNDRVFAETDNMHLRKDHIGFADGSDWTGGMDETVVGPQVLDKTHKLELRPITHYPTKAPVVGDDGRVEMLHEPDPIEGYIVRVSTFSGNPLRRFRRLYLTSHDHLLIYTVPSHSHSPAMQNVGDIDPEALVFCITPHKSADLDHKDMAQSRSVRRLKAQVRSAQGFIDMTKIGSVRVLKVEEWNYARHLMFKTNKERQDHERESRLARLGKAVKHMKEDVVEAIKRHDPSIAQQQQQQPDIVVGEADNYFFPTEISMPFESDESQGSSSQQQEHRHIQIQEAHIDRGTDLHPSEPLSHRLGSSMSTGDLKSTGHHDSSNGTFKHALHNTATFVVDALHPSRHNDPCDDSNVIEIEMEDGKSCVRFRAYNSEAARLWRDQLEKLAEYWRHRKHQDVRDHMAVQKANSQQSSNEDDDEHHVTIGGAGITIQDWDNDRAVVSPEIWNWCVVNGCRSVTKSGFVYYKPKFLKTFRRMFLVLTEGFLMLFHPHRRSRVTGKVVPSTACKLFGIYSLKDIYIYSGHFSDEDTHHGTNDESEHLARFFPDGLIVDDPDEDCTFSIWRGQRKKMFSRRGSALMSMSSRPVKGSSKLFGENGFFSSMFKDGIVYGARARQCSVVRARSRPDLEEWVYAINTEIERIVRAERRRIHYTGQM
ncbi:hypothetical protein BGX26_009693 [Mortierella sp. AD094]|nr:hypothetical protein BGX26_009693 [Mortierella sp. AD094]